MARRVRFPIWSRPMKQHVTIPIDQAQEGIPYRGTTNQLLRPLN